MGGPTYANGEVPEHLLVKDGEHLFFPGTHARWVGFRQDVFGETGVWLYVTPGPNAYRSLAEQKRMRQELGTQAAVPGTSSHGGLWTGQTKGHSGVPTWVSGVVSGAIDVGNWASVPWSVFEKHARAVGFIPDIVVPTEKWHLVDLNPWTVPTSAAAATPIPLPEEDDMSAPIINVVEKIGDKPDSGVLYIGRADGGFHKYTGQYQNIRGVLSVAFFGSNGEDKIPTVVRRDFDAVQHAWQIMCQGRTDAAALADAMIPAQEVTADGKVLPAKSKVKYRLRDFITSTNAIANWTAELLRSERTKSES